MEQQQNTTKGTMVVSTGISEADRIQQWYYDPIEEQEDHRGITILMLIIPIYERYLRYAFSHDSGFGYGSAPIKEIANQFAITQEQAYHFWQIMRNGLLHRSAPKEMVGLKQYGLTGGGQAISEPHLGQLIINPYAIREQLLPMFKSNPAFWSQSGYPVPDEVTIVDGWQQADTTNPTTQTQPYVP